MSRYKKYYEPIIIIICLIIAIINTLVKDSFYLEIDGLIAPIIKKEDLYENLNNYLKHQNSVLEGLNNFFYETNFYEKVISKRISLEKVKVVLVPKTIKASWNNFLIFDDGSLGQMPENLNIAYQFKCNFSQDLVINQEKIDQVIEKLKKNKVSKAIINVSSFQTLEIILNNNSSIFLSIFDMEFIFNNIFQYFDGNIPPNKEIIAFYEDGFVLNEKRSAKI